MLTRKRGCARNEIAEKNRAMEDDDLLDEVPLIKRCKKIQVALNGGLQDGRINTYCNVNEVDNKIRSILTWAELRTFTDTAFGNILDIPEVPWISGQLLLSLVGNYINPSDGCEDRLTFRLLGNDLTFTKTHFHLITGLKMYGSKPKMEKSLTGDFALRYFGSKKSVRRQDVSLAFSSFKRDAVHTQPDDALKMSLIYVLSSALFGNQASVTIPHLYINLVDDLERFNNYPWGDDVWADLVGHVQRCKISVDKGGTGRPTFAGYMFALQTWAFETFPSLVEAGMCEVVPGRVDEIPRCLKWKMCGKFNAVRVSSLIFGGDQVLWNDIVPTAAEKNLESVKELLSKETKSALKGKMKVGEESSTSAHSKKKGGTHVLGNKKLSLRAAKDTRNRDERASDGGSLMTMPGNVCRDFGSGSNKFLKKKVNTNLKKDDIQLKAGGSEDLCKSNGACECTQLISQIQDIKATQEGQGKLIEKILRILEKGTGVENGSKDEVAKQVIDDNAEKMGTDVDAVGIKSFVGDVLEEEAAKESNEDAPNFEILTPMQKNSIELDIGGVGSASFSEDHETVDGKINHQIPLTDTQYYDKDLEDMDKAVEMIKGSEDNTGLIRSSEDGQVDSIVSGIISGDAGQDVLESQQAIVLYTGVLRGSNSCVEVQRPKRIHKSPDRYTPSDAAPDLKKRKLDRMQRNKQRVTDAAERECYGPFAKDPKEMPPASDIEEVRTFVNEGLMKRKVKSASAGSYTMDPITLDGFKVDNKTWLYELFTSTEWLSSTHVEVAMHFLEVKRAHYSLMQTYTTTSPYFLQGVKIFQERVDVGKAMKEDVKDNSSLMGEVKRLTREYAKPWAECDFVYMPLNTGSHWMLLVLEVEGRKIRVYNSKGRKSQTVREIAPYMRSITSMLPTMVDIAEVYTQHPDGPMGDREFKVDIVDGCPQQSDGSNCGMFVVKFAEFLMMDRDVAEVTSKDMEAYRVKMTTELLSYSKKRAKEVEQI